MRTRFKSSRLLKGILLFWLAVLTLTAGCDRAQEPISVDFSKTVPAIKPQSGLDQQAEHNLRVAVGAMISPRKTFSYYQELLAYLQDRLGRRVELVQKKTYAETNLLLAKGEIDMAFICSGPYATQGRNMGLKLLAAPQVAGATTYRSYLIVHRDSSYKSLANLAGSTFAFTDPDSNTGWLVPRFWLLQAGQTPRRFFGKFLFTHGHDNSILAVAKKLVDGAAVDSLIWDYHQAIYPSLTAKTRIIRRSQSFGIPPVVGSPNLSVKTGKAVQEQLFAMHLNDRGRKILTELRIDRFVPAQDDWYQNIRQMHAALMDDGEGLQHGSAKP